MDAPLLSDQQNLTFISSMQTLDAVWRTYQEQWLRGTDGKRESIESVLCVRHDDNDDNEEISLQMEILNTKF